MISAFDIFKPGIGPSSSHTVGPMKAGYQFSQVLQHSSLLTRVTRVQVIFYGSLAATGKGHGTPPALLLGLEGAQPESVDPDWISARYQALQTGAELQLVHAAAVIIALQQGRVAAAVAVGHRGGYPLQLCAFDAVQLDLDCAAGATVRGVQNVCGQTSHGFYAPPEVSHRETRTLSGQ